MSAEMKRLMNELADASAIRHAQCQRVAAWLAEALAAVEMIRRSDRLGVDRLRKLCRGVPYDGAVLYLPVDVLLGAEVDRQCLLEELRELDTVVEEANK